MDIAKYLDGPEASLSDVLNNKDERALRQQKLLEAFSMPLVSFSVNIPGPKKRFALADKCYSEGKQALELLFSAKGFKVMDFLESLSVAGSECLWVVNAAAGDLKLEAAVIEETHMMGRLFDIDIIGVDGEKLTRTDLDYGERTCLVCGKAGSGCARSRAHDVTELQEAAIKLILNYFDDMFCKSISEAALKALLYEVAVSPKPGLVDRLDNGAHDDMDFFTFIDSACALKDYFYEVSMASISLSHKKPDKILPYLSCLGIKAENKMLAATKNVNTHKGAVYSLGILSSAYAYAYKNDINPEGEDFFALCSKIAEPSLKGFQAEDKQTAGKQIYNAYGITGARGEAASGFESVRRFGLPSLRKCLDNGMSLNDSGVSALLHIMAATIDTNVIKRGGLKRSLEIKEEVSRAVKSNGGVELLSFADKLNRILISENISPGGSADLLALTFMVMFMEDSITGIMR